MIFNEFNPDQDIVSGRTTRVASGFWPDGTTTIVQTTFVDDFWSLSISPTLSPSYGNSLGDVRKTMYYLNVFPGTSFLTNSDPYFSISYGHIAGDVGSGSFGLETASIKVSPTKTIYTEYKNTLLGTSDLDGKFTMKNGDGTVNADDIWILDFSAYKMKDRIDEGFLQISFSGSNGQFSFIDDSRFTTQTQTVYQMIAGNLSTPPATPAYEGIGLLYPSNGIIVLNASLLAQKVGISGSFNSDGPGINGSWPYTPGLADASVDYTYNHKTLFESMRICTNAMNIRKSEYVLSRHYFVRVMNRDFNYSNNPTYVYNGSDGVHPAGLIYNQDFISNPTTYVTTVGLYNDTNELVAVAKLSRPALKTFDNELLIKVRLDF